MNRLKEKEKEIGLVDLDRAEENMTAQYVEKQVKRDSHIQLAAVLFVLGTALMLCLSLFFLHIPVFIIGLVIVLEAVLARLLKDILLWFHFGVMLFQILMGLFFHKFLFLLLAAAFYFVLVLVLKLMELD